MGAVRKSPGGWLTVSPNATGAMTRDDARSAKALFLACFPSSFPGIVFSLSQNRQPGVEPEYSVATPDAPCVFFCVCLVHLLFTHRFLRPLLYLRNGGSGGTPSGWPVPVEAGFSPRLGYHQ